MLFVSYTVEPRYCEGHGEWQLHGDRDLFVKTRFFCYSEVIFYTFNYYWGEGYCSFYRGLAYIEVRYFVVSLYIVEWSQKRKNVFRESCFHRWTICCYFPSFLCLESTNFTSASSWFSCGHFYSFLLPLNVYSRLKISPTSYFTWFSRENQLRFYSCVGAARKASPDWSQKTMTSLFQLFQYCLWSELGTIVDFSSEQPILEWLSSFLSYVTVILVTPPKIFKSILWIFSNFSFLFSCTRCDQVSFSDYFIGSGSRTHSGQDDQSGNRLSVSS